MRNTGKTAWFKKTKNIIITATAGLGITGAGIWAAACNVSKYAETQYIRPYVEEQSKRVFIEMHKEDDSLNSLLDYRVKLLCVIEEINTPDSVLQRALVKMKDTASIWDVH